MHRDPASQLRLSELVGRPVRSDRSEALGTVADIVVDTALAPPRAAQLVVRIGRDRVEVDWSQVVLVDHDRIEIARSDPLQAFDDDLGPTQVLLARDVLDAQIVDLTGHRLVRAADVVLTLADDTTTMVVVGVDVGVAAVLRRLGLRRWAARRAPEIVAWDELHLASRRGHEVQLEADNAHLHHLSPDDLAHLLARLSTEHAGGVLGSASVEQAAAAIAASHDEVAGRLLASLSPDQADELLGALPQERASTLRTVAPLSYRGRRRQFHRTRGWRRHAPHERHRPVP